MVRANEDRAAAADDAQHFQRQRRHDRALRLHHDRHAPDDAIATKWAGEYNSTPYTDYRVMIEKTKPEFIVALGKHVAMPAEFRFLVDTGIPFLMDLPLFGRIFSHNTRIETKRDLLILITPHIVDEGDMQMTPRRNP